ncbi:MAG TPA: hypothetical protein VIK33_05795 [Anaerolineae bacterium]
MREQITSPRTTQRWLTNSQMRDALLVVEDLLKRTGQTAVLRLSGLERYIDQLPPRNDRPDIPRGDITALFAGIVSMFGEQGARGVLRRWGRAFAAKRAESHIALRLLRIGLRLAAPETAARFALIRLLHYIDLAREDQPPALEDREDHFTLELTDCVYCIGLGQPQPSCPAVVGLLEGLLRWVTGRDYEVTEEALIAPGQPLFKIRKHPLDRR